MKLSDKEINYNLFGLLLGDGWINNRKGKCNKQLTIQHSMKQESYVKLLEKLFKEWGIFRYSRYNQHKIATWGPFDYCTVCSDIPDIRHFLKFNRFYSDDGKKLISKYVMQRITPLGLMLWFMDDGCLTVRKRKSLAKNPKPGIYRMTRWAEIATYSFSMQDHLIAQEWFNKRFGINVKINRNCGKNKKGWKLYFSATEFRKLHDIVKPYLHLVPEDMRYKFHMGYIPDRNKENEFLNYNMPQSTTSHVDDDIVHSVENISKETVVKVNDNSHRTERVWKY